HHMTDSITNLLLWKDLISFQPPGLKTVNMVTPLVCDRMFGEKRVYLKTQNGTENEDRLEDQD
ncbi:unnamed protein product, partial [Bubo scandiacus]